jgi:hypothetical protein
MIPPAAGRFSSRLLRSASSVRLMLDSHIACRGERARLPLVPVVVWISGMSGGDTLGQPFSGGRLHPATVWAIMPGGG